MAAAGPPASMNHNLNGLMNQGQFGAALQHQLQLQQQQLLLSKQPPASKGDAPLHTIQQQQYGAYDAAVGRQLVPGQYVKYQVRDQGAQGNAGTLQHGAHAADQQKLAQQHPSSVLAGSAVTGALVNTLPAVTGNQQLAQHSVPNPSSAPAAAAAKQEPGSPAAHSPTSSALPTAPGSPTAELSAPLSAPPPGEGSGTAAGGRYKLPPPSPLPPPDASEGPEAAAEYSRYLERWEEGSTLAQRWYRLSQKGVLGDIVEEWEDWQHERLLRGLQAQNKAAARQARKHKRDEVEVDLDAPRQTRTRRVPQALQDYQVEAVTAGTPEPPAIVNGSTPAGPAAAAGVRAMGVPSRGTAQQPHTAALEDAEVTYAEGATGSDSMSGAAGTAYMSRAARAAAPVAASKLNRPSAATAAVTGPKAQLVYNKAPAPGPQQQYNGHLYQQQQQQPVQRAPGSNGYAQGAQPQKAQQPQQQARINGYADASRAYDSSVVQGGNQAAAAALGRWPGQAQQQQQQVASSRYQQQPTNQHQQHMGASYQQQNGYNPGAMAPAVSHDMMSQLLHMGGMVNNSAAAAAMPAAAVSMPLPQALAAAAAALPPGIDYNAAFDAFTKVLGRVDPVAFTQHFSAAMQQQRQHH